MKTVSQQVKEQLEKVAQLQDIVEKRLQELEDAKTNRP